MWTLIIEGGGNRGAFAAGVLDLFLDNKLRFDRVAGVSAGALHGSNFLSGQKGRTVEYMAKYCHDPRYMSLRSLIRTGSLFNVDFCYRQIPDKLYPFDYEAFARCGCEFYAVSTSLRTGDPRYIRLCDLRKQEEMDLLRASASMPLAAVPVPYGDDLLLDGGVSDSIPIGRFYEEGGQCVVILTQAAGFRKKPMGLMPLFRLWYRKYPAFVRKLEQRHELYNQALDRIAELEKAGKIFVIRPPVPPDVSRIETNAEKILALHRTGYETAEKAFASLERYLHHV